MSLTITLPPDVERTLGDRARAHGQELAEYATQVLVDVVGRSGTTQFRTAADLTHAERLAAFNATVAAARDQPLSAHPVDDSRETIYGGPDGRGE